MKTKYIYLILFCAISNFVLSQDTLTLYYDNDWVETPKSEAVFYRKAVSNTNKTWSVYDYYINDTLQMTGSYSSQKFISRQGYFVYYYGNGKKSSQGNCLNNKYHGPWTAWHENGNLHYEGEYVNNKAQGIWKYYHETGEKKTEGKFLDGNKDGLWNYWHTNGQLSNVEDFKKGVLLSSTGYYENGNLKYTENYIRGKRQGECTYRNVDGKVTLKGIYTNDVPVGEWIRSFPDGSEMKLNYVNGTITGKQLGGIIKAEQ
jgi:antitoxin component YwqK of YwqJK toxin-antitoxin module